MALLKSIVGISLFFSTFILNAQPIDYNITDGYLAGGYDVVSYFNGHAEEGKISLAYKYDGANFLFKNTLNRELFISNPSKYLPQYGGYCAYAIAINGKKVSINPESFEIRDGKLYLFYNTIFANTLKKWKNNNPALLSRKADIQWEKLKYIEN